MVIVNTDLITLTVTVTDTYGRYVSGLSKNAFTAFEEKQPREITYFSDDDAPVSVRAEENGESGPSFFPLALRKVGEAETV
ncbi:MAG: hypothetical protein LC794_04625 [Acidobacteria bacterium]|nr:hypothetical protein [Acidobacteriota bacterium]